MAEVPNIAVPPPYPAGAQNGAGGGGILRPGAIDQAQFQKMLEAQYQAQSRGKAPEPAPGMTLADYRKLAGMPANTAAPPTPANPTAGFAQPAAKQVAATPASDGIPTLSLEQFAALTGLSLPESTPAPIPVSIPASPGTGAIALATSQVEIADAGSFDVPPEEAPSGEAPVEPSAISDQGVADGVPVGVPTEAPDAAAPAADSRVVMLDTYPDREEQRQLAAQGKTWHMKETPGARELFLGPDGKFGWDDFVDIINPLQHIPVVAQIYRAVTGDQAYGLSAFLGAIPLGPISVASAVADTVIRAQTGRDAGTDMAARIFGIDNRTPEEADLRLAHGSGSDLASAGGTETIQVADARLAQPVASGSAWTRDSAGIARD